MKDLIIGLIVLAIVGAAVIYIVRAKKRGVKCVGCPESKNCTGEGGCTCHGLSNIKFKENKGNEGAG